MGGVLFVLSAYVDDADASGVIWLGLLTFAFVWLYFPLTCGSLLVYEKVTQPYLEPRLKPFQRKMNNFLLYVYQALANAVHLYLVWIIFMFLPVGLKRIVAIAVGTVYPFVSSVAAASTDEIDDDTYWLTYWSVYGCLFVLMNVMEQWLGRIPGFYTLVIFTTVYLMVRRVEWPAHVPSWIWYITLMRFTSPTASHVSGGRCVILKQLAVPLPLFVSCKYSRTAPDRQSVPKGSRAFGWTSGNVRIHCCQYPF